jgi:hypothetical protein
MTLNERIQTLESQIVILHDKIEELSINTENKSGKPPYTIVGDTNPSSSYPSDIVTGHGQISGGAVAWNNSELDRPPSNQEITVIPTVGYNKHSHSRFSGGALIKDVLEIVEYVWESIINKHSQQYWNPRPKIATDINSRGITVEKIGKLDLNFNPDTLTWGSTCYEIQVDECYLVMRDNNGDILKDDNGNDMKSTLYDEDPTLTNLIWDATSKKWRLIAVYASGEEGD